MPTGSSRRGLAGSGHAVSARQRYAIGSGTAYHEFGVRMAGAADCRVLLLDYRLAPEHPFPAAVDDAVAAYRYLLEESARPGRVVIAGDSAGGGLALATLARLQDEGEALPTLVSASRPGPIWRPPVIPIAPGQWTIRWFGSMGCGKWRGYMPRTTCAIRWHHRYLPTSRVFRPFTWRSEFGRRSSTNVNNRLADARIFCSVVWRRSSSTGTPERLTEQLRRLEVELPLGYLLAAPLSHEGFDLLTERVIPQLG